VFGAQFQGKVRYETFDGLEDVDPFRQAAEQVARITYQRGLGAGFVNNEENRQRLILAARKGWLRAYVAFLEDKPLAFWYGERVGDTLYLIWTGFDPSYRKFEIGTILFLKMVEDVLSCGIKEIDYGLGWAQYKERFGDYCLEEQNLAIYAPTLKGYALNSLCALTDLGSWAGSRLLSWLNLRDRIKRIWRSARASKLPSGGPNTTARGSRDLPKTASGARGEVENPVLVDPTD
jgi:hypothetical protein